jgi:hemolysin activation/secretion protein
VAALLLLYVAAPATSFAQAQAAVTPAANMQETGRVADDRFDVFEYRVAGNTRLSREEIETALYDFLGPGRRIDDVEAARTALETRYRDAGYPTCVVDLPEQQVLEGIVRFEIIEGRVGRLEVSGAKHFSAGRITARVPSLAAGKVPHLPELQRELAALNAASADRSITPVLRPGEAPGTVDIELQVKERSPWHGSIALSDRYSRGTERLRLNAGLSYANLWDREHTLGLNYQVAPEARSQVEVWSANYVARLAQSGITLIGYAVASDSDVATVGTLGVRGRGGILGLRAIVPLPARQRFGHSVTLGADYKDFQESIGLIDTAAIETPISYHRFSAAYQANWVRERLRARLGMELGFAFRGLGNAPDEFEDKRFQAQPNFLLLKPSAELLFGDADGPTALLRIAGQLTPHPLVSNEQLNAGGADSARGYFESEALGDNGYIATIEFGSPPLASGLAGMIDSARWHLFFDLARLWVLDPLPSQRTDFLLASAGLGLRLDLAYGLAAELELAERLAKGPSSGGRGARVHFRLGYEF